jgi:hypothetical protein
MVFVSLIALPTLRRPDLYQSKAQAPCGFVQPLFLGYPLTRGEIAEVRMVDARRARLGLGPLRLRRESFQ